MKPLLLAALALSAGAPLPAAAQGPAVVRGVVYACDDRAPLAHVPVVLRSLSDGVTLRLTSDARGRFERVGVAPGRWLVAVEPASPDAARVPLPLRRANALTAPASRLARLETDDVLDLAIGTRIVPAADVTDALVDDTLSAPRPQCDAPLVPSAPPLSDRYIIR